MSTPVKKTFTVGARVYAKMHDCAGKVVRIWKSKHIPPRDVFEVHLDNGDTRRYMVNDLVLEKK